MAEYFRIATKDFCNTLLPGAFTGDTTMCPTRSQIESTVLYIRHYKIFCINGKYGIQSEFRIFYFRFFSV